MSAKVMKGLGLALALAALAALYVDASARNSRAEASQKKNHAAAEEQACGEGCWLPFF